MRFLQTIPSTHSNIALFEVVDKKWLYELLRLFFKSCIFRENTQHHFEASKGVGEELEFLKVRKELDENLGLVSCPHDTT
jgi:hypothetical protein